MSILGIVNPGRDFLQLQKAFKLAFSMVLLYWLALWLNWDMPKYGALAIALISLDTTGASLHKGVMRIVGTTAGLAVGMLGLALFAQDSWLTLMYNASYLIVVGYFMQSSRYPYAWFVAGFLPTLVWATTYGNVDNVFHYATFRYLETTAGIVIYTVVSIIFWPRRAGDELKAQGHDLWWGLQNLFGMYRRQLEEGVLSSDAPAMRAKFAGATSQLLATIQAAYADTPSVASKKRAWEALRVNARAIGDAMELWRQSITDCRHLDLDRSLPEFRSSLEKLDQRLARISDLWQIRFAGEEATDSADGDDGLLEPLQLEVSRDVASDLAHLDRAALFSFVQQLNALDLTSQELLRTMRVLAGLDPVRNLKSQKLPADLYRPSRWDPMRLINGLLPAVCFVVGYFFWIYFNPPTGPSVPNMAVTFGLMVLLTPMRMLKLLPAVLVVMVGFIAPVYFLIMPRLSTGPELLLLVFAYAFSVGLLRGRLAPLRALGLPLFVMMTGISNQQSYSFMGLVDGAQMLILGIGIVAVVQALLSPARPEQILRSSVRQFFRGCARVTSGFALEDSSERDEPHRVSGRFARKTWSSAQRLIFTASRRSKGRRLRKRYFASMVMPAFAKIRTAQKHLDYIRYPDNSPEEVQRLVDAMQVITNRLRSLEIAHARFARQESESVESSVSLGGQVRETLQRMFECLAGLEIGEEFEQLRDSLQQQSRDLQHQMDSPESGGERESISDKTLIGYYTILGGVRGLAEAIGNAQAAISHINWSQLATTRF